MTDLSGSPPPDPLPVFKQWLSQAVELTDRPNPHSFVLATSGTHGRADARVLLLKYYDDEKGYLVFYTNYLSDKGIQMAACPEASAVFHWDRLGLQARVRGPVLMSPASESDAYFATRGWESQLAAWASDQSKTIASRTDLEARMNEAAGRFGGDSSEWRQRTLPGTVTRPPHWGGYRLWIRSVELWMQGEARLHDRIRWSRDLEPVGNAGFQAGVWRARRLQP